MSKGQNPVDAMMQVEGRMIQKGLCRRAVQGTWHAFQQFRRAARCDGKAMRTMTAAALLAMGSFFPLSPAQAGTSAEVSMAAVSHAAMYRLSDRERKDAYLLSDRQISKILAAGLLKDALQEESQVTADMRALESRGASLAGLDYRLKDRESLTRKIMGKAEEKSVSLFEAADDIGDVLRYTVLADSESYSGFVPQAIAELTARGYRVEKFHNAWGGKFYQGVNVRFASAGGVPFEVQFHTPQSFAVKQESHEVYEIRRSPDATPAEIADATEKSLAYNAKVITPEGADAIAWTLAA